MIAMHSERLPSERISEPSRVRLRPPVQISTSRRNPVSADDEAWPQPTRVRSRRRARWRASRSTLLLIAQSPHRMPLRSRITRNAGLDGPRRPCPTCGASRTRHDDSQNRSNWSSHGNLPDCALGRRRKEALRKRRFGSISSSAQLAGLHRPMCLLSAFATTESTVIVDGYDTRRDLSAESEKVLTKP